MPTRSDQLNGENVQPGCTSNGHDTEPRRAQLSHMVQAATRNLSQLQRDGEWGSYEADRLAEVGYALHRATVALSEIDNAVRGHGADEIAVAPPTTPQAVGQSA